MTTLHQIIAVEKDIKGRAQQKLTEAYHQIQKPALLAGISRTYHPKNEEGEAGEMFPPESTRVQLRGAQLINEVSVALTHLFDIVATKDHANCLAKADVVVDGKTLLTGVPATHLLFLEKQLVDVHTFVKKLPVLDPAEKWSFDGTSDCWATEVTQQGKTKKNYHVISKAKPTQVHPEQTEVIYLDETIGYWHTIKFSGALPATYVNTILARVERLQQAVKFAREQANGQQVTDIKEGENILSYLFAQE